MAATAYCSTSSPSYLDLLDRCNVIPFPISTLPFTYISPNQHRKSHQFCLGRTTTSFFSPRVRLPRRANAIGRKIFGTYGRWFLTIVKAEAELIGSHDSPIQEGSNKGNDVPVSEESLCQSNVKKLVP